MVNKNQIDTEKFSKFYQKISSELEQLESDFLNLEKEYFAITPSYEKIFNRLEKIQKVASENEATLIHYRVKNLQREVAHFHKKSGYNLDAFHNIFKHLHALKSKLPDEIFSEPALKIIREKVKLEASRWIQDGLPKKSNLHKYMALINDDMHFLLPFKRKIWEKKVENKKRMRIQIKSLEGENIFSFQSLPGNDEDRVKEKIAILLETEKGSKFGILTDKIDGIMIFSEKFIAKKKDYFPVSDGNFTPYLTLKGIRYFIREDFE